MKELREDQEVESENMNDLLRLINAKNNSRIINRIMRENNKLFRKRSADKQ